MQEFMEERGEKNDILNLDLFTAGEGCKIKEKPRR